MLLLVHALALDTRQWRHGYDLMQETGLQSGTLYKLLLRMTEQGLVEAQWCEPTRAGRPPRHIYRLTAAGMMLAREAVAPAGSVVAAVART